MSLFSIFFKRCAWIDVDLLVKQIQGKMSYHKKNGHFHVFWDDVMIQLLIQSQLVHRPSNERRDVNCTEETQENAYTWMKGSMLYPETVGRILMSVVLLLTLIFTNSQLGDTRGRHSYGSAALLRRLGI